VERLLKYSLKAVVVPPGLSLSHSRAHMFRGVFAGPGRNLVAVVVVFFVELLTVLAGGRVELGIARGGDKVVRDTS
jgi:hypothetical protein